jgi:hypothetical protein
MRSSKLAALVLPALALWALACTEGPARAVKEAAAAEVTTQPDQVPDNVVVYYFHASRRCRTCLGIQQTITRTLQERFAEQTASGQLSLVEVDYEAPENRPLVLSYKLAFGSMVVAARKGDSTLKWENCSKVWELARDPEALSDYTEQRIRTHLAMLESS